MQPQSKSVFRLPTIPSSPLQGYKPSCTQSEVWTVPQASSPSVRKNRNVLKQVQVHKRSHYFETQRSKTEVLGPKLLTLSVFVLHNMLFMALMLKTRKTALKMLKRQFFCQSENKGGCYSRYINIYVLLISKLDVLMIFLLAVMDLC